MAFVEAAAGFYPALRPHASCRCPSRENQSRRSCSEEEEIVHMRRSVAECHDLMGGAVLVIDLPVSRIDLREGGARSKADEEKRIAGVEIRNGVAVSLPRPEPELVIAAIAGHHIASETAGDLI